MNKSKVSLIVQPGDSFFPIVEAIDAARTSINITIFRLDDPVIQKALREAVGRGVRVRALIAKFARGWEKENKKLLKELAKSGIETKQASSSSAKKRYHYKILTVDESRSLILTFNPTRENLHYTRDYGVVMYDGNVTRELTRLFDADWFDSAFSVNEDLPLAISPYNSRARLLEFLGSARRSIHISDAKVEDRQILDLLRAKADAGVQVRLLGSKPPAKGDSSVEYRQITRFKMHAKCTVVDSERAFIASMNMRPVSLDSRREVGIFIDDPKVLAELEHVFDNDWSQKSRSMQTVKTVVPGAVIAAGNPDAPAAPAADYALLSRTDAMCRYPLVAGANSIGRSSTNDIVIGHPSVSRSHATIAILGTTYEIEDLGSQNGTFLNGEAVKGKVALRPGDIVGIGQSDEFRFIEV